MSDNLKEPILTYALDSSRKMVHIGSVERGLSCNCRCSKCNESLVAKLGHEGGRQAHFAHRKDSHCHGSYMSALHKLAEQIIEDEMMVMAPAYKEIDKRLLIFDKVQVEQRLERKDLQPDLVGITTDGLRWMIEIRNTHEVDDAKKAKLIESCFTCLEIDVREQKLETLKSFLLDSAESREWINNPHYDLEIAENIRRKVSVIEGLLLKSKEIPIPTYNDISQQVVYVKDTMLMSKSDDGLFARIKVISSDEKSFVFNIGNNDHIENAKRTLLHECDEFSVTTDNLPCDQITTLDVLHVKWAYHFSTEKERETRIREYKANPCYEVKDQSFCYSECRYHPFHGECIYQKATFKSNGTDLVICDVKKRRNDESDSSQNRVVNNLSSYRRFNDSPPRVVPKDNLFTVTPVPISRNEVLKVHSHSIRQEGRIPFSRFWTVDEYYEELKSSDVYEIKDGIAAEIVECEKIDNRIMLLYKSPQEAREFCPYHIVIISIYNGNLVSNMVADFTNKICAHESFCNRLRSMRDQPFIDKSNNELPF